MFNYLRESSSFRFMIKWKATGSFSSSSITELSGKTTMVCFQWVGGQEGFVDRHTGLDLSLAEGNVHSNQMQTP